MDRELNFSLNYEQQAREVEDVVKKIILYHYGKGYLLGGKTSVILTL